MALNTVITDYWRCIIRVSSSRQVGFGYPPYSETTKLVGKVRLLGCISFGTTETVTQCIELGLE